MHQVFNTSITIDLRSILNGTLDWNRAVDNFVRGLAVDTTVAVTTDICVILFCCIIVFDSIRLLNGVMSIGVYINRM
jgi:hypothetical protein